MEHLYEVSVDWTSGRKGLASSPVLNSALEVATPPEFPGGLAGIWSPEHLFVAAINSCFMTTFLAIAENSKLEFTSFSCRAFGQLIQENGKYHIREVNLLPVVTVAASAKDRALRVLQKSESNCLISNSVRSVIRCQPELRTT